MTKYHDITGRFEKLNVLRRSMMFSKFDDKKIHFKQLPALEFILRHEGCTQSELAEYLNITPATVAVSTKRMQKAGLIEKIEDSENLRQKKLCITDMGYHAVTECRKIFDECDEKIYSGITDEELEALKNILDKITINITGEKKNNVDMNEVLHLKHKIHQKHKEIFSSDDDKDDDKIEK